MEQHSLYKKSYRGGGGNGNGSVYDDVFGGSRQPKYNNVPNLSPRLEDYNEIFESFHSSRGSSIPILDLPAIDYTSEDYCLDVRSSRFDYSEVFGGFDDVDFAVSYEELFSCSKGGGAVDDDADDSSDDAWTPAQSESLSDDSDPSASFERNQSLSYGDLDQSFGRIEQPEVYYNKTSAKTEEDILNATGDISQFHAGLGSTAFINETQRSWKIVDEKLPRQESSDLKSSMDLGGRVTQDKLPKRAKSYDSYPSNTESAREEYGQNVNSLQGHEKQCSDEIRSQLSVSGISLKTQPSQLPPPSRPPPALTVDKKDSGRLNSKLKASKSDAFELKGGNSSPTYFDVEIDASSSAAVSAAAMKDAVDKAQAKLRSAKESMGRKKEGLQSHLKVSDNDSIGREERLSKNNDKTRGVKNERMLGDFGDEDSRIRHHAREAREKLRKTTGSVEEQNVITVTKNSVERKHGKEHKSSLGSHKTEESLAQREEAQFYQNLGENYVKEARVVNKITKSRVHDSNSRSTVDVLEQKDHRNRMNTTEGCEWEEKQSISQLPNGTCQWDENMDSLMLDKTYHQEVRLGPKPCDLKEQGKKLRGTHQLGETETILKEADESVECENLIEIQLKEDKVEIEGKLNGSSRSPALETKITHTNEKQDQVQTQGFDSEYFIGIGETVLQADSDRRQKKSSKDAKEKQYKEGSKRAGKEKTQNNHKREKPQRVVQQFATKDNKERFRKDFELEEIEGQTEMTVELERNMQTPESEKRKTKEMVTGSQKQEKNHSKLEAVPTLEENAGKQQSAGGEVENGNIAWQKEGEQNTNKVAWSPEESKKMLQEGFKSEISREATFKEEGKEKLVAKLGVEDGNIVQDAGDMVNFKGQNGMHETDDQKNDCRLCSNEDIGASIEKNLKGFNGAYVTNPIEVSQPTLVCSHDRDSGNVGTTQEALSCDGHEKSSIDLRYCEEKATIVVPDELIEKVRTIAEEETNSSFHLQHTEIVPNDGGSVTARSSIKNEKHASDIAPELVNANILAPNQVGGGKKAREVQCNTDHEGSKDEFICPQSQEQRDGEKIADTPRVVVKGKPSNTDNSDPKDTSQRVKKEDKNCKTASIPDDKEKQERLKRERERENDRLRKIEEERERQREREKDMMSIDRATLEARERAFVENRERVERATVDRAATEVRQKALAEARERLEKACAEARERTLIGKSSIGRSFTEKASVEARIRAERVAVERTAAQAREQAEKAVSEKAAPEARERGERSVPDNLSASSRSVGMRQNSLPSDLLDPKSQSMGSYSVSRYSHTSAHGGDETESPQRCKARLERHRRTAERAQKALAEKNMRDFLAQKEQAERNRLAEGLDAEVRRWCSGKEGNLRALLSTLQYILGPDSGWQPVPLTDVITTAAAKKAYRKATLCVHPDKLQQRGATVQQKYICEKVFDLLKEAWNKFNSVER